MASFRCYDNSDVIATLIKTNFRLYLIQLWCQFFQIFAYGDGVYAQTWEVLTLKNYIELNYTFFAVNCLFISHDFRRHIIAERSIRNIIKSACSRYSQNAIKRNMVDLFLCLVRTCILSSLFSSFLITAIAVFLFVFFKCHC